jgi:hypothetical protein
LVRWEKKKGLVESFILPTDPKLHHGMAEWWKHPRRRSACCRIFEPKGGQYKISSQPFAGKKGGRGIAVLVQYPCRLHQRGAGGGGAAVALPQVIVSPAVRLLASSCDYMKDLITFQIFC